MSHLLGLDERRLEGNPPLLGPLLENFVAVELGKQVAWSVTRPTLYHFRSHAGHEVDLVLEGFEGSLVGIEVKAGASLGAADLKGLRLLKEVGGEKFVRGVVLYGGDQTIPFAANLHALPIRALWSVP